MMNIIQLMYIFLYGQSSYVFCLFKPQCYGLNICISQIICCSLNCQVSPKFIAVIFTPKGDGINTWRSLGGV